MSLVDLGKQLLELAKKGETEEIRSLMANGAPFTTDWLGASPLHMAAQYGHATTAEVLLRAGISRDARTKVDRTALHIASQEGHTDIVEMLLKHGADIKAKDMLKMTPLHWAVERGHISVINVLLTYSANSQSSNKFNKTPVDIAQDNCRMDIIRLFQDHIAFRKANPNFVPKKEIKVPKKGPRFILPKPQQTTTPINVDSKELPVTVNKQIQPTKDIKQEMLVDDIKQELPVNDIKPEVPIHVIKQESICVEQKESTCVEQKESICVEQKESICVEQKESICVEQKESISIDKQELHINVHKQEVHINVHKVEKPINIKQEFSIDLLYEPELCIDYTEPEPIASPKISTKVLPDPDTISTSTNTKTSHPMCIKDGSPSSPGITKVSSTEIDEGDASDQSCTNVLATLAALAEATAPNATISTQEAVQWLELHGITMLPTDNSTVVAAALEGGQSVSLTEAGKLALTWVKEDLASTSASENPSTTRKKSSTKSTVSSNQKLITKETDKSQTPLDYENADSGVDQQKPLSAKKARIRKRFFKKKLKASVNAASATATAIATAVVDDDEKISLRKELDKIKKEAAVYKAKLEMKEHEADEYRRQLEKYFTWKPKT